MTGKDLVIFTYYNLGGAHLICKDERVKFVCKLCAPTLPLSKWSLWHEEEFFIAQNESHYRKLVAAADFTSSSAAAIPSERDKIIY